MKDKLILNTFIILFFFAFLTNNQILRASETIPIDRKGDIQYVNQQSIQPSDVKFVYRMIEDAQTKNQLSNGFGNRAAAGLNKVDLYYLATNMFNSQGYFPMCDRCKKFQYFAFRLGGNYLTAKPTNLVMQASTSPTNDQLFIGEQQIDGTWALRSLSNGKYIRADNNGVTINYQTYAGPWERWYIQRHGDHCHIQSAQFIHNYWTFGGGVLQQFNGGASSVIVQHWPVLKWLWNY